MTHEEAEILSRNTYRRMIRKRRARRVQAAKLLLLWFGCFTIVTALVMILTAIQVESVALRWVILISFTVILVYQACEVERAIKNPPKTRQCQ